MNYLHRGLEGKILELREYFPVIAILGARQVGKTTLVQNLPIDNLKTVTFDPVEDIGQAREDPDFFLQNQPRPLFLDEIQYAPELLSSVKREVDSRREPGLFILSGSHNLSVLRTISESLAGRVAIVELLPLSLAEMAGDPLRSGWLERVVLDRTAETARGSAPPPSLLDAIWRGGLPGTLGMPDRLRPTYFDSYQRTYIERDVRTAAEISSLQAFGRFFGLLAALTGTEINHSDLGRALGVDRKTAAAWTAIAFATYQWYEIPAYSRNAVKRVAGRTKGHFVDTGLACHLQRIPEPDALSRHPLAGRLFETLVAGEIRKRVGGWAQAPGIHHYRTYAGAEVDLVLERGGVLHPIEIKMTTKPSRRDLRGIASFRSAFPRTEVGHGLVVCAVPEPTPLTGDVTAVPWWEL